MPGQLVFGRDMILNTPFIDDWEYIRLRRQNVVDKNNQLKNKNRKLYLYRIGNKLLAHLKKGISMRIRT